MPSDLLAAVVAAWDAASGLAGCPLYLGRPPATGAFPYAVLYPLGQSTARTTGDAYTGTQSVQLSIFAAGAAAAFALGKAARAAFDPAKSRARLSWTNGYEMSCRCTDDRTWQEPGGRAHGLGGEPFGMGGVPVYHRMLTYSFSVGGTA